MNRWALPLMMYGALACVLGIAGLGIFGVPRDLDLTEHAAMTEGIVIGQTCENHATVLYSFRANGHNYQANGQPLHDNCEQVHSNNHVWVWYMPDAPQRSSLQVPSDVLENDIITAAIMAIILPALILGRVIWRAVRTRKSDGAGSLRRFVSGMKKQREVWFQRGLIGGWSPIHWKGYLLLFGGVGLFFAFFWGADLTSKLGGPAILAVLFNVIAFLILVLVWIISLLHSQSWDKRKSK